jgi:hypothetical protein
MAENWRDGKRQMAKDAYDLTGVHILTETLVQRVVIETRSGEKVATGVQLADGKGAIVSANKEVIVSAGAYRTPQVLMLSGIGHKSELSSHGITQIVDAPEVGRNFHDYLSQTLWWKLRHPELGQSVGTPLWTDPAYFLGKPIDWVVFSQAPREQLAPALAQESESHEHLLDPECYHTETLVVYVPTGKLTGYELPMDGTYISSCQYLAAESPLRPRMQRMIQSTTLTFTHQKLTGSFSAMGFAKSSNSSSGLPKGKKWSKARLSPRIASLSLWNPPMKRSMTE